MHTLYRSVFTLVVLILAYGVLIKAFDSMNLPSDRAFFTGVGLILAMLVAVPTILHMIWKKER